jgi:hypothetical protein
MVTREGGARNRLGPSSASRTFCWFDPTSRETLFEAEGFDIEERCVAELGYFLARPADSKLMSGTAGTVEPTLACQ